MKLMMTPKWTIPLVVAALFAIACGSAQQPAQPGAPAGSEPPPVATTPPKPKPAGDSITDDGQLLVGTEVKPGTYRATVPADSVGCYYARLKNLEGSVDSIIANGIGKPGEKVTVTIKAADKAFQTDGCGDWAKIS
jgi:hypothetical protein